MGTRIKNMRIAGFGSPLQINQNSTLHNNTFVGDEDNSLQNNLKLTTLNNNNYNDTVLQHEQVFEKVKPKINKPVTNSNFHKLGTMVDHNVRKISIVDKNRRNTQFNQDDTQAIVDNLSPFIMPS